MQQGGELLSFEWIIRQLRETATTLPDKRQGENCHYSITDIALSAFAVFFSQSPSFLDFQRGISRAQGQHNTASLFGVSDIPSDNHIRTILDEVPADRLYPVFDGIVDQLSASGALDQFRSINNDLLLTIDGTEYYRSEKISCPHCRVSHHSNGTTSYSHAVLTPAFVTPGRGDVIALSPEFIRKEDGKTKADNEIVAAKRWLSRVEDHLSPLSVTVMGDDMFANQPFLTQVSEAEMNFLCICKPQSHRYLTEYIESLRATGEIEHLTETEKSKRETRTITYEWIEDVPIRDGDDAMRANWLSVAILGKDGKRIYTNSFITNHPVSADTVASLVEAGRARWKIENEDINTLKTKGYHLEHNFGHGTNHLSETLATLNILAFLLHTLLDLYDQRYRLLRRERGHRSRFFQELGTLLGYLYFDDWPSLMHFMIHQLKLPDPGG